MERLRLYLQGGAIAEFTAEKFVVTHSSYGVVTKIEWDGDCKPYMACWQAEAILMATIVSPQQLGGTRP